MSRALGRSSRAIFFSSTVSSYFRCLYCCSSSCLRIFPRVQFGVTSAQVKRSAKRIININSTRISCVSVRKERGEERGADFRPTSPHNSKTGIEFDRQRNRHHQQPESEQFALNTDACCKSQMITHVLPTHNIHLHQPDCSQQSFLFLSICGKPIFPHHHDPPSLLPRHHPSILAHYHPQLH